MGRLRWIEKIDRQYTDTKIHRNIKEQKNRKYVEGMQAFMLEFAAHCRGEDVDIIASLALAFSSFASYHTKANQAQ